MAKDQAIQNQRNAINEGSKTVRNTYLSYLAVTVYIWIAIEGITHTQLLIPDDKLQLPVLNIGLPVVDFFFIAPILLLLMHTYFMIHVTQFAILLSDHSKQEGLSETWRQELNPSIFSGFFLAKEEKWSLAEWLRDAFVLVSFWCVIPIVLCRIQLKFLPYHHSFITPLHQGLLVLSVLLAVYFFLRIKPMQRGVSTYRWIGEFGTDFTGITNKKKLQRFWNVLSNLLAISFCALFIIGILLFSLTILTIPQDLNENDTCFASYQRPFEKIALLLTPNLRERLIVRRERGDNNPCIQINDVVARNLILREKKLAPGPSDILIAAFKDEPEKLFERTKSLALQGRDLRFANFFKSDLTKAELRDTQLQGIDLEEAKLQGADFLRAKLLGANLKLAQLQGTNLKNASLLGADLSSADLLGANLESVNLLGAGLGHAKIQGANLQKADLRGTSLVNARLQGADFSFTHIEGADLMHASLEGANLYNVYLNGADLSEAIIEKLDLSDNEIHQLAKKIPNVEMRKIFLNLMGKATKRKDTLEYISNVIDVRHDCEGRDYCGALKELETLTENGIREVREEIYWNLICEHPVLVDIQLKTKNGTRNFIFSKDEMIEKQKGC